MEYTGSSYTGDKVAGRMEGKGTYVFPSGTKYVGEMKDGEFHGHGILYFPNGGSFEADWRHGKAIGPTPSGGQYTFHDSLKYEEGDWTYCDEDDRRFYTERIGGIQPAGRSQLTDKATHIIPIGTYDCGDGYYDPTVRQIFNYDGSPLRQPAAEEEQWIVAKCRHG